MSDRLNTKRLLDLAASLEGAPVNPPDAAAMAEILRALPKLCEYYEWIWRMKADRDPYTQQALRAAATWIEIRWAGE